MAAAQRGRVAVARVVLVGRMITEVMLRGRRVGDGALAADVGGERLQGGAACGAAGSGLGA